MTRNLISLLGSSAAMMALLIGSVFGASATVEGYRRSDFRQLNQLILGGVMDGLIAYNQYLLAEKGAGILLASQSCAYRPASR